MLTGYTSLFSVLHAAGSFQCCLLARSCRLPTCSYRFTTPSCSLSTRSSTCSCRFTTPSCSLSTRSCRLPTCSCRFTTPSCRLSTRACRLSTCSCALHSTNSRSPKMLCILLVQNHYLPVSLIHNLLESLIHNLLVSLVHNLLESLIHNLLVSPFVGRSYATDTVVTTSPVWARVGKRDESQRAHERRVKESCVSLPNFAGNGVVWLNGAYREFYQHVGQYIVPAQARARVKKGRERARTSSGFSLRNRSSPQFLRLQLVPPSSSVHVSNAVRATPFSSPATPPGNSHIVQPRRKPGDGSAEKQREIPTRRTGETTCFFPAHREKTRVWALESHVTDNFTLRTMGGVLTCRLLRNVQQICCSAQTGQHSRLQRSCCPVWALQHIHTQPTGITYTQPTGITYTQPTGITYTQSLIHNLLESLIHNLLESLIHNLLVSLIHNLLVSLIHNLLESLIHNLLVSLTGITSERPRTCGQSRRACYQNGVVHC